MKTYSGKYKVKNISKYEGDPRNVVYRSMWERHCFEWCDSNPEILKWSSEEVVVPYFYDVDKKYHKYYIDLKIKFKNKKVFLVEVKPHSQTKPPRGNKRSKRYISEAFTFIKNQQKWEAADSYAKDRGWQFEVWTEKELTEMNILPKTPGRLKELEKLKPFKKRKRRTK